jgi:hypothetical protein
MKSISTFPTFSLVTVSFAGIAVFAVIDQAEAGKGITASGSRTYSVSPIVRGGGHAPDDGNGQSQSAAHRPRA